MSQFENNKKNILQLNLLIYAIKMFSLII